MAHWCMNLSGVRAVDLREIFCLGVSSVLKNLTVTLLGKEAGRDDPEADNFENLNGGLPWMFIDPLP
jgi:hypothetical protein